jgi:hypothetical protein
MRSCYRSPGGCRSAPLFSAHRRSGHRTYCRWQRPAKLTDCLPVPPPRRAWTRRGMVPEAVLQAAWRDAPAKRTRMDVPAKRPAAFAGWHPRLRSKRPGGGGSTSHPRVLLVQLHTRVFPVQLHPASRAARHGMHTLTRRGESADDRSTGLDARMPAKQTGFS